MPTPESYIGKQDTVSPEFLKKMEKQQEEFIFAAKYAEIEKKLSQMEKHTLSSSVMKLENRHEKAISLLGEIIATLSLPQNQEYFVDFDERWSDLIESWRSHCKTLGVYKDDESK
jgi:hypothetical protein